MNKGHTPHVWWMGLLCLAACDDKSAPPYLDIVVKLDGGGSDPIGGDISGGGISGGDISGGGGGPSGGAAWGRDYVEGILNGPQPTTPADAVAAMEETCHTLSPDRVHVVGNFKLLAMGSPQAVWDMARPGFPCLSTSGLTVLPETGRLVITGSSGGVYEHVFDPPTRTGTSYTDLTRTPNPVLISEELCPSISEVFAYPDRSDVFVVCSLSANYVGEPDAAPSPIAVPVSLLAVGRKGFALATRFDTVGRFLGLIYGDSTKQTTLDLAATGTVLAARSFGDGILLATLNETTGVTRLQLLSADGSIVERGEYPAPDEPIGDSLSRSKLDAEGALYDVTVRNNLQTVIKRSVGGDGEEIVFQRTDPFKPYGLQIRTIDIIRLVTGP